MILKTIIAIAAIHGSTNAKSDSLPPLHTIREENIRSDGPANITIQFIVHLNGQITDLAIVANPDQSNLDALAKKALLEGPSWVPATQNGYTVVSYQRQVVMLGL